MSACRREVRCAEMAETKAAYPVNWEGTGLEKERGLSRWVETRGEMW